MLRKEDFVMIQDQVRAGVYQKDIAAQLGVHPKTVSRSLKRGSAPAVGRPRGLKKLEPYRETVDRLLGEGVWNAVVIFGRIKSRGYAGGYSQLKRYIGPKRVLQPSRKTVRFETDPGRQMQSDWGEITTIVGGMPMRVSFIVNTLGYSRRMHVWVTDSQDAEHTYEGIVRAFEYFGGVPREVLVDNQRCAVLEHRSGERPRFHPRFVDLAAHCGFAPRACQRGRARTKGKDERMVRYIKEHFFVLYRSFESLTHMNQLLERWLAEVADARVHGTVKEVVGERFERERPVLALLPLTRYDTSYRESRIAGWDAYIDVRGNRYSVPCHLAGARVTIRISFENVLTVFDGETIVAEHRLRSREQGWVTVPDHHADLWHDVFEVERRPLTSYEEVA